MVGLSTSAELLDTLMARIEPVQDTGAVVRLVQVAELEHALAVSETFAPEHLQLMGPESESLVPGSPTPAACWSAPTPDGVRRLHRRL